MTAIPQARRTLRLLGLPAASVADSVRSVVRRASGQDPDVVRAELREDSAKRTRRVLGELKGGALKAGQLVSTVEMLLPQDPEQTWRDTMVSLQQDVPALPFEDVTPVLAAELGANWRDVLPTLDTQASAAASLGQVHRGRLANGHDVAVKVQYPGVAEALAGDIRTIALVSTVVARLAPSIALPPLVSELRVRLLEELDYEHEAGVQRRFAAAFRGSEEVLVPEVHLATRRVLVMDWMDGAPLAVVARTGDQSARDAIAVRYQRFMLGAPSQVGLLHTDPHPGNFRLLADGRLGVLDFGSSLDLPDGLPPSFGRLIRALQAGDPDDVTEALRRAGLVHPGRPVRAAALMDYLSPFSEPARHETFHYTRSWLREEFGKVNDPRNPDFAAALSLTIPAEQLFTHRVWLGVVGVLCQLEARVPVQAELTRLLPGFAPTSG